MIALVIGDDGDNGIPGRPGKHGARGNQGRPGVNGKLGETGVMLLTLADFSLVNTTIHLYLCYHLIHSK